MLHRAAESVGRSAEAILVHLTAAQHTGPGWKKWLARAAPRAFEAIRFRARAREVLGHFPGREDPNQSRAILERNESLSLPELELGGVVGPARVGATRVAITIAQGMGPSSSFADESAFVLTVTGPRGRIARAATTEIREGEPPICPTPTTCEPSPDGPSERHLLFDGAHPTPMFASPGRHQLQVHTTYGGLQWGPTAVIAR